MYHSHHYFHDVAPKEHLVANHPGFLGDQVELLLAPGTEALHFGHLVGQHQSMMVSRSCLLATLLEQEVEQHHHARLELPLQYCHVKVLGKGS